jgi:hypothetical protein
MAIALSGPDAGNIRAKWQDHVRVNNRFGLRCGKLLLRFGCCSLRTSRAEATGKPAPVICVDVGVVSSPRNGYVRKAAVDRQLAFLCVHVDQHSIAVCP